MPRLLVPLLLAVVAGCGLFTKELTPEEAFFERLNDNGEWLSVYDPDDPEALGSIYAFGYPARATFGYTLYGVGDGSARAVLSGGTVTVGLVDGDPDAAVLTYTATRGAALPPDRARLERGGGVLVLRGVDGGEPRRFESGPGFL